MGAALREEPAGPTIVERVHELNAGFSEPLPHREALDIAYSIHRWITTCSRMWADGPAVYEATFSTMQAVRGQKGGTKSGEKRWRGLTTQDFLEAADGR